MGKQLLRRRSPRRLEGNDRHLRRLLRIKPGERPDLQDLWEYLQDLRYTDIQNSLLAHRFLSVLNYGVRIYEALATKYGGFVERLYPVLADRAIFDKHLTSKQSAAVSEFIRQTNLEEVDDQLGQKHREAANSPPGVERAAPSPRFGDAQWERPTERAIVQPALILGMLFHCRAGMVSNGCTSRSTFAAILSSAISRS
jgi:hypothetical protein